MLSTQPIFILREALQYLTNQRIVAPGYTYLQDMVGPTDSRLQSPIDSLGEDLHKEIVRLLDPKDATVTMQGSPSSQASSHPDPATRQFQRLGDYEILRQLGRGGMGSVFLARRADGAFNKEVAIKILRSDAASPDIIRRFHREREILAQLFGAWQEFPIGDLLNLPTPGT